MQSDRNAVLTRNGLRLEFDQSSTLPPVSRQGLYAFIVVYNEQLRLPFVLEHHRKIGVSHFFIVNDKSSDDTHEIITTGPHRDIISVYNCDASYKNARGGLDWVEALMDRHANGAWALKIDADELFVYDRYESRDISNMTRYLTENSFDGALSFMLDIYPNGPLRESRYAPGCPLFEAADMFDGDLVIMRRPGILTSTSPTVMVTGGARTRVFYPEIHPPSQRFLKRVRARRMLSKAIAKIGIDKVLVPPIPPILEKIPLRRWHAGTSRYYSAHHTDKISVSPMISALLHFKYLYDFHDRVIQAIGRAQYFDQSSEYKRYYDAIKEDDEWTMANSLSLKYRDSSQLAELNFFNKF